MARRSVALLLSLSLWSLALGLAAAQTQTPSVFRAGTNLVLVDAYPQRDGRIVEGLTPDDFDVLEDGVPQKVDAFEFVRIDPGVSGAARRDPNNVREMREQAADPHNRVFVVYLDTLHTTVEGSNVIRAPLVNALDQIIGPDDLFGVMTPDMRPRDLTLGRLTQSIDTQLTKYWTWGQRDRITTDPNDPVEAQLHECFHQKSLPSGIVDWLVPDGAAMRFLDEVLIERRREDRVMTSLQDLVAYLPTLRDARIVVMAITDGWVLFGENHALADEAAKGGQPVPRVCATEIGRLAFLDDDRRFRDLVTQASRTNLSFYPLATSGLAVFDSSLRERVFTNPNDRSGATMLTRDAGRLTGRVQALRTIAENTDGIAVVNTNDLAGGIKKIVDDVSAYYLLGYTSTNAKADGRFRRIQVKMKKPGLTVHARRGYLSTSEAARTAATAAANAAAAAAPSAGVADALNALGRLRSSADLFIYGVARVGRLAVVAEIPGAQMEAGKFGQGADVQVTVTGENGEALAPVNGHIDAASRGALVAVPLPAGSSGPWRVNVRVSAGADRLEDRASVDPPSPTVLLSAPVLYRAAPGPRAPIQPVADFLFRRTERVHVEWPILKALDQRQARLLGKNGQPLAVAVNVTERQVDGAAMLAADVNLAPLGPGDYVIEVTAGSGTQLETRLVGIRVEQ
jgi:VWFA-related protein